MNYKVMMIGLSMIFLMTLMAPSARAEVRCYIIPGQTVPVCIPDRGVGYLSQMYIQERPRYDIKIEGRRPAPQHNYSECTFATGCNPYK